MEILNVRHLLILLASLFFLPALRAIDFEYCNKSGYDFGNVSRVEVSRNPVELEEYPTIKIFGYDNKSIDEGSVEVHVTAGETTHMMERYTLCVVGSECAIAAGTNFVLVLAEVPLKYIEEESKYVYSVRLMDEDVGDSQEPVLRMCVEFEIPIVDLALVSAESS
ncbi:hypothetical protein Bca4012_036401 [Brassica carinata]|uniref:MD-2-related lipid-recognition domain-containing protein n=1 Tax=Brassica carinata TaxID=52824 RepID=A0A8X7WDC7_BRACI|nr:hypothetical protein Bca52824_010129 [Brassica carinata]